MAMENPVRLIGGGGTASWPLNKETTVSQSGNMVEQDLGIVFKEQHFLGGKHESVPNRSGSAPPSMEGSFAALGNLIGQFRGRDGILASTSNSVMHVTEEELRADPSYIAYYFSNVNLNPRLPPPLTSRENRHVLQQIHRLGDNHRLSSVDDSNKGYLLSSRAPLSTHTEEAEDDSSPSQVSIGTPTMSGYEFAAVQLTSSSESRHKSLVDLTQDDFPRTPSPVYTHQPHFTNRGINEAASESNFRGDHFHSTTKTPGPCNSAGSASLRICSVDSTPDHHVSTTLVSNRSVSERKITRHSVPEENSSLKDVNVVPILADSSINRSQHVRKQPLIIKSHTQVTPSQVHAQSHALPHSHGINHTQNSSDHFPHIQPKIPAAADMKLPKKTAAVTPPLYAAATGYMSSGSPFYSNLQPSSLYAPTYVGGYAVNASVMPPFIAGYPLPGAIRMGLENSPAVNLNGSGGSIAPGTDLQSLYKLYGQLGAAMNPPFCDPLFLPYFQHQSVDAYGAAGRYDPSYDMQKGPSQASYIPEQRAPYLRSSINIQIPTNCGPSSPSYYGSPSNLGVLMQYPASPIASGQVPGSGSTLPIKRSENLRLPVSSSRSAGSCSGWQGQRGRERTDDAKMYSFLEEFKTSKARRFELSDIAGRIIEFSTDQHGSRFIQQKLESCTSEEKSSVFEEVLPHASTLMTDVFGNYVIQKFFEHGNAVQRRKLANQLSGHILPLSLQMYGCRVIQKALEVIELNQKTQLVSELDGHVMRCVRDQNGNHVIQKCIECVPTEKIGFIISSFRGHVANLSTHPYGCRVIQRVLEYCTDELQSQCIVDEVLQSACFLAQDQYGNYVTQHVLERGKPHERSQIITKLAGQIVQMSQNKFASNVIEKCLEHGGAAERELLINEIVGQTDGNENLLIMMKDQYANYVIQKILETCAEKQQETLLSRIRAHLPALRKYTYGKHIVARVEQLSVEESNTSFG